MYRHYKLLPYISNLCLEVLSKQTFTLVKTGGESATFWTAITSSVVAMFLLSIPSFVHAFWKRNFKNFKDMFVRIILSKLNSGKKKSNRLCLIQCLYSFQFISHILWSIGNTCLYIQIEIFYGDYMKWRHTGLPLVN